MNMLGELDMLTDLIESADDFILSAGKDQNHT